MSFIIIIYLRTILKKIIYEDIECSVEKMKSNTSKYNFMFSIYLFYILIYFINSCHSFLFVI